MRRESPKHTRAPGSCSSPYAKAVPWKCPACLSREEKYQNPRQTDAGHTNEPGECRWAETPQRRGRHPRDPRPVATDHPSAEVSGYDASLDQSQPTMDVPPAYEVDPGNTTPRGPTPGQPSSSGAGSGSSTAGHRGPDQQQRERSSRTWQSTGEASATRLPDWTRFNVQVSLRNLRSYEPSVVQKEMRKLHLRWWHASEPKMRLVLQSAGVDEARLAMIKPIVDTCRECRIWQKRGHEIKPSLDVTVKFLEKGETDLMFYRSHIGFHAIDRALRFSGGMEIPDKFPHSLLKGYKLSWFKYYGPFKILYSDG